MLPVDATTEVPVIVFVRAPVPGRCKTRLIPRYGRIGAARIHRQLVRRTLEMVRQADCGPVSLRGAPDTAHPFLSALARRYALSRGRQCSGDLGRRMSRALDQALSRGAPAALLVGTDAANLEAADLRRAKQWLLQAGGVFLQPAADGGFVLIGSACRLGGVLRGVAWSSGAERRQTRARMQARGIAVHEGQRRWDVDRAADVRRARREGCLHGLGTLLPDRPKA